MNIKITVDGPLSPEIRRGKQVFVLYVYANGEIIGEEVFKTLFERECSRTRVQTEWTSKILKGLNEL